MRGNITHRTSVCNDTVPVPACSTPAWHLGRSLAPVLLDCGKGPECNRVFSPWNMADITEMLLLGSAGATRAALAERIGVGAEGAPGLSPASAAEGDRPYSTAEAAWLDSVSARPTHEFLDACARRGLPVERRRLADPAAGEAISAWIAQSTRGLLRPKVELSPADLACLVSAIYFKDGWEDPFDPDLSREGEFCLSTGGKVPAHFMTCVDTMSVVDHMRCSVTSRTFKSGARMAFVLPKRGVSVDDLVRKNVAFDAVRDYFGSARVHHRESVELSVPRFDLASSYSGLEQELMCTGEQDLSPMVGDQSAVLKVVHEARVSVDEEGVEAAAYAMAMVCTGCVEPRKPREFILDRPFAFAIVSAEGELLFLGVVRQV